MKGIRQILALCVVSAFFFGIQSCTSKNGADSPGRKSDTPIVAKVRSAATKVPAITTGRLQAAPYGKFVMDAWVDSDYIDHSISSTELQTDRHVIKGVDVLYDNGSAKWDLAKEEYWINGVNMRFWCYAPESINGIRTITGQSDNRSDMDFSYVLPAGGYMLDGKYADATRQDDLLFSYNKESRSFDISDNIISHSGSRSDDKIDITFEHALSQVSFAICVSDNSFNLNLVDDILIISLSNVASSADCTFDGEAPDGNFFSWGEPGATSTYTQGYALDNLGYYSKDSAGSVIIGGVSKEFPNLNDMRTIQQSFMMIPQTLGEYASISATFKFTDTDGKQQTVSRSVSLAGERWLPGKYYTYKIKASTIGRDIKFTVSLSDWGDANESLIV